MCAARRDPDSVVLCLLATDEEDEDDIALQIHFTLLQAFCGDNDINILRVSGTTRLAQLLGDHTGDEPRDLHCILVTVSPDPLDSHQSGSEHLKNRFRFRCTSLNPSCFCRTRRSSRCSARPCMTSAGSARRSAAGTSGCPAWTCRTAERNRAAVGRRKELMTEPNGRSSCRRTSRRLGGADRNRLDRVARSGWRTWDLGPGAGPNRTVLQRWRFLKDCRRVRSCA